MKTAIPQFLIALLIACLGLSQNAPAVSPPPDGGYPGGNTAEGQNALLNLRTGTYNTAVGFLSLESDTAGQFNTAVGAGALLANVGDPSSQAGVENTATGAGALLTNTTGFQETANGAFALFSNTIGGGNTAIGASTLFRNTTGGANTAIGVNALFGNTLGNANAALGGAALANNEAGNFNTAVGFAALNNNIADNNIALGYLAGAEQTTGGNNIYIGANIPGVAGESNACYIGSIFMQTSAGGIPVLIDSNNKLGTTTSSKRFKENIKPMDKASEGLYALKPVTFHYKKEIDRAGIAQFGLVAEEVEKVSPDLVVRDKEGKPYSVRYDQVNAMLLNEFLREHRKVEEQEGTIAGLQKQIDALTAGLQKVNAQLEASKPVPKVVNNP